MFLRHVLLFFVFPWMSICGWPVHVGYSGLGPEPGSRFTQSERRCTFEWSVFSKIPGKNFQQSHFEYSISFTTLYFRARFCPDCWRYSFQGFRGFCTKLTSWFACVLIDGLGLLLSALLARTCLLNSCLFGHWYLPRLVLHTDTQRPLSRWKIQ